jgi:hypothetical protein
MVQELRRSSAEWQGVAIAAHAELAFSASGPAVGTAHSHVVAAAAREPIDARLLPVTANAIQATRTFAPAEPKPEATTNNVSIGGIKRRASQQVRLICPCSALESFISDSL